MGINHAGKPEIAFKIVKSAFRAGAKIIKNKTHIAEDEYSYEAKIEYLIMQKQLLI